MVPLIINPINTPYIVGIMVYPRSKQILGGLNSGPGPSIPRGPPSHFPYEIVDPNGLDIHPKIVVGLEKGDSG